MNYLKSKYLNQDNILIYFCSSNSLKRIIILLLDQFIKIFFSKLSKEISIFLLPQNRNFLNYKIKVIENNKFDPKYFSYLKRKFIQI